MLKPNTVASSTTHLLAGLDHLRALAITLVFIFHYRLFMHPEWIVTIGKFGWTGVDLFFVLSGYLISSQLFAKVAQGKKVGIKEFYFKRFLRIMPAYLFMVALYFLVPAYGEFKGLMPLWRYLTFTLNFGLDRQLYATFTHAWSLCVEEQFYLIFPLIIGAAIYLKSGKKAFYLLPILFVGGFIVRYITWQQKIVPVIDTDDFATDWMMWIYYPTQTRLDALLMGISVAAIFQFFPNVKAWFATRGNQVLIVSLAIITGAYFLNLERYTFIAAFAGFTVVAIGYGVLVAAAVCPSCVLYKTRSRVTFFIAQLSYSFYLTHKGIIHVTQTFFTQHGVDGNGNLMVLICLVNCLAGAMLLHYIVEKPFLYLRDKILKQRKEARLQKVAPVALEVA